MTRLKPPPPCPGISVKELFDPQKPATTLGAVALSLGAGPVTLNHPGAPLGLIQIDAAACTLCGRCSQLCPTGALAQAESVEGRAELTFNPRACPACRLCLPVCPELSRKAIALRWAVDLQALAVGRATLHQSHTLACLSCGADMGAEELLERVAGKVAEVDPRLSRMVRSYCSACRAGPAGQGLLTGQETPP